MFQRKSASRSAMLCLLGAATFLAAPGAQAQVVISQAYGGGGNVGAPLNADYVELFNAGNAPQSLADWSIQYASSAGTSWTLLPLPATMIPAGGYFLVKVSSTGMNGAALPTPDFDSALISAAATNGKFALASTSVALSGGCPIGASVLDFVGYGSANCFEGTAAAGVLSATSAAIRGGNGCNDTNQNSADFTVAAPAPRNSTTPAAPCGGGTRTLSINDVSVTEGNSGTVTATFTVSLTQSAGAGGVTFDIATADATAAIADNDYVPRSLTGQAIAEGASSYAFDVTVHGDTHTEPNETFFVNVTNVVGAAVGDTQGVGTIINDDFVLTPISSVQGSGAASPLLGQAVSVRGIVTSRVNNGFYLQSQASDADSDPTTSEGLFVFTSAVPPATAAVGNLLQVTATVAEFIPPSDPNRQPLTQLTGPAVIQLSTANPLPAPVDLTTLLPSAGGGVEQLERLENMRVRVPTLTVVAPTGGTISEANATASTNGRFYGVVGNTQRPFREPGIEVEDAVGLPSTIPRWDNNPEKLSIESVRARNAANALRASIDVDVGATLADVVGVLDYSFRNHRITVDFDAAPVVSGGRIPVAVSPATGSEITVAAYNLQRFFDDQNDPAIGEPVLTAQAFQNRLQKASLGIRGFLRTPDFIGVSEVENLTTLQALATRINADAVNAGQTDPQYVARLEQGNDVGGIDVGFLVKTTPVAGSTPRVAINGAVQQLGASEPLRCPDGTPVAGSLLNDRPSLVLDATVAAGNGTTAPVTVIVNHLRSLGGVNSSDAETGVNACFVTAGNRVRIKRLQQAAFIANAIQTRQTANPNQNIVLVGDFNAFEFNDGFTDVMGVISGAPAPDNQTLVPGDGVDLVTPDFVNLTLAPSTPTGERYSFLFSGNAQSLDHVLVSGALATAATSLRLEHARINADFGEDNRADPGIPVRVSDHDPLVVFIGLPDFGLPDAIFSNGFEPQLRAD